MCEQYDWRAGNRLPEHHDTQTKMSRTDVRLIFLICHSDVSFSLEPGKRSLFFDPGQASCCLFLVI